MPTNGASFAALSSGDVGLADPPNSNGGAGANNGTSSRNVYDLTVLKVDVNVPTSANCLVFDTVFYSEEYPEYVGSQYNDAFVAELDHDTWVYDSASNTVAAPDNFAFDDQGHPLSVNSAAFTDGTDTLLQYDGSTKLLHAAAPASPGAHSLYFSIYDAGDHIYDSAALIDNLRAVHDDACQTGSAIADTDGDGLPDNWETGPADINGDGTPDIDLHAMGARADHKDIFVQADAMQGLRLSADALAMVTKAFADSPVHNPDGTDGINLHVDNGPGSIMNPANGQTWGALSKAATVSQQKVLGFYNGSNYDWSAFSTIRSAHLDPIRSSIFRYMLSIDRYGSASNTSSGIARGIPSSDFLVALGSWCVPEGGCLPSVTTQAGTFMHELGHTLGLHHGGHTDVNNVPNYLSVMNYRFQSVGLRGAPDKVDYSRFDSGTLAPLDENQLNEPFGFGPEPPTFTSNRYITLIHCAGGDATYVVGPSIDFSCDFDANDSGVSADINGDGQKSQLVSYNDWSSLVFKGGSVGGLGLDDLAPANTTDDEPPSQELQQNADLLEVPPDVSTSAAADVTQHSATLRASANPQGHAAQVRFSYGPTTDLGQETDWQDIGSDNAIHAASAQIGSLAAGTTYYFRAVVRTSTHQLFGEQGSLVTGADQQPASPAPGSVEPPVGPSVKPPLTTQSKPVVHKPCAGLRGPKLTSCRFKSQLAGCRKLRGAKRQRACQIAVQVRRHCAKKHGHKLAVCRRQQAHAHRKH